MTDNEQRERSRLHVLWATGRATMRQMDRCRELDNKARAEELARNEMSDKQPERRRR